MIPIRRHRCECGDDMPGHCPGVMNCPYSSYEPPIEEDDPATLLDRRIIPEEDEDDDE